MKRFEHVSATSVDEAVTLLGTQNARAIAGGTDLLGIMKDSLLTTDRVVDLKTIKDLDHIKEEGSEIRIGALAKLVDIAASSLVRQKAPALVQAAALVASPQIRNTGTIGGNLAQKTRCWYYRDPDRADCYKRGGGYCYAVFGASDVHALFDGAACFAVNPSDTAVALAALDASIVVAGTAGRRVVPIDKFFIGPDVDYTRETALAANEIIVEVRIPTSQLAQKSVFVKAAPRASIDFARGSVAAAYVGDPIASVRVALGAVAPTPKRAADAEAYLAGKRLTGDVISAAAELSTKGAKALASNDYKIQLTQGLVRQALRRLAS